MQRKGDSHRWEYANGSVSAPQRIDDFVRGLGDAFAGRLYEVWDRSLGCWVVYA